MLFIFKNLILPAGRRGFLKKNKQKQTKKTQFYELKIGPIMLHNILGPFLNLYLDQFFTYKMYFFGGETSIFIVFSAKMQNLQKHKKGKKTLFVNTTNRNALVKMSVLFSAFFSFAVFPISIFSEIFLTGFQKSRQTTK